jgi:predicted kinase
MEAVIFIGLQASGKSTFYNRFFADTHVRVNLDTLKTRFREKTLILECLSQKQSFVVDNTNLTKKERAVYIGTAKNNEYEVIGYYFRSVLEECLPRNEKRVDNERVPRLGLLSAAKKLEKPEYNEGFDELNYVVIRPNGEFKVEKWKNNNEF